MLGGLDPFCNPFLGGKLGEKGRGCLGTLAVIVGYRYRKRVCSSRGKGQILEGDIDAFFIYLLLRIEYKNISVLENAKTKAFLKGVVSVGIQFPCKSCATETCGSRMMTSLICVV